MRNLGVDSQLAEITYFLNRENLIEYADASGDQNPIHLDENYAKSVGLPNVIAHGMLTMALAGKAAESWAGENSEVIEFSTRFINPVIIPSGEDVAVIFTGKITAIENGIAYFDLAAFAQGIKVLGMTKLRVRF